jgi:NAD(P)-dependent dehydrogenase (short-subunit alcohol dehydrogenase family)
MPGKLDGKVALITGGGTGIGLATAKEFAHEGAEVYITGRRKPELDAAATSIGPGVTAIQGDVTKPKDLDRIYGQIGQEKGHVDIVFANAGIGELAPFGSITEDHFDRVFGTNVKGLVFTAQKALPLMSDGGTIIMTGSEASIKGFPDTSVYSATKAAVRSFARTWTTDLKDRGIRVNVVSPGPVQTEMLSDTFASQPEAMDEVTSTVSMGRLGRPEELAKTVTFLASDDASFITGDEIFVDGGGAQV